MKYKIEMLGLAMATTLLVSMVAAAGVSAAKPATVGGPVTGAPGATNVGGTVWLVAQGATSPGGNIYYQIGTTGWLGPVGTGTNPCIVALGTTGTVDIFWVSTSGALVGRTTTNGGAAWTAITLPPSQVAAGTGPAATYNAATGEVDVFYVNSGTNALMWDSLPANANNMQQNLGGIVTASPGAVAPRAILTTLAGAPATTTGSIDVFVRGSTGALYEKVYSMGGFGGWTKFHDGVLAAGTGPTAVANILTPDPVLTSNVFLFVTGTTGNLYELYSNDGGLTWNTAQPNGHALGWMDLGGILKSSPSAVAPLLLVGSQPTVGAPINNIAVVVRGGDGGIWTDTGFAPYNATSDWHWSGPLAGP